MRYTDHSVLFVQRVRAGIRSASLASDSETQNGGGLSTLRASHALSSSETLDRKDKMLARAVSAIFFRLVER